MTESNYNYAFIAGRDPRNDRPAAPKPPASELDTLVEAISVMANWRRRGPYQCSVLYQANGRLQQFELQVWPGVQSYHCVNKETGIVDSYDAETGVYISGNERREREPNQFMTEPLAARLAFPMSLNVWGHPSSGFRMIGASRQGDEILVRLQHQIDPHVFGCVTVDTQERRVIRLDTPMDTCRYEDIMPIGG